ncbi:MAG TPA: peptidoglycan-binding protein, partial [Cyanobacteria bacterium UBA12227]|nr:peptidoglycan-binding protein [Cyanobacteria bacterium UBA12227]
PTALGLQSVNQSVAVGANGGSAAVATAPPPVTRPQPRTLEERIIAYCEDKGYQIDRGPGEKNIIYVEGMYPDGQLNDDKANAWNDTRMVIEFKDGKPVVLGKWEATTEPGRYYTMNPMNAGGVARIAFGQHRAWQLGRHGQADPHEALVQTGGPLTVYRDLNKDGMRSGDRTDTGHFGVNQHWGGDSPK